MVTTSKLMPKPSARVLFVDMNSFFASCEQQVNYFLRNRPVGVCVYPGQFGCIIAPSIEAKKYGVKTGMRLFEAMQLCPQLVPLETNPERYRQFHVKIMAVLKKYSNDVFPKSIDEAVVNLSEYELIHKDVLQVAADIKRDIKTEVGDWLKCSIGVAPNAFLAKLASDIKKPDGLTIIDKDNIDEVLSKLKLTDLPGIGDKMALRLNKGGITTPLQMRHTSPENLKAILRSVVGFYWHCRLNFIEVDLDNEHDYKSMQAMRHLSREQRKSDASINDIFLTLCLTLERRMMQRQFFCHNIGFGIRYANGERWDDFIKLGTPMQDGVEIFRALTNRMNDFIKQTKSNALIHSGIISISIHVSQFIKSNLVAYNLFEDNSKKDKLRQTVYDLKERFGKDKVQRAVELKEEGAYKDVIGFGSVKDLIEDEEIIVTEGNTEDDFFI
jgi:DNA polymerase IV